MAKQYKTLGEDIWKNKVEKIVSSPPLSQPAHSASYPARLIKETVSQLMEKCVILNHHDKDTFGRRTRSS